MDDYLKSDAAARSFLTNLPDYAIFFLDTDGNIVSWNEGAYRLKGYTANDILGQNFSIFYTPEARTVGHPERELAAAATLGRYEEEGWRVRKDKTRFWAHIIITPLFDDTGVLRGFGKILRDYTLQKQAAEQSENVMKLLDLTSRTDYLTGLDNRRSFDKALSKAISNSRNHAGPLCIAMIDLDRFKGFNDQFGHQAGDLYLKQASLAWRLALRPDDLLSRYGGEEFIVILANTTLEAAYSCLDRLRAATPKPLTCSMGLAQWDGTEPASVLIDRADHALYLAKTSGRDRIETAQVAVPAIQTVNQAPGALATGLSIVEPPPAQERTLTLQVKSR